MSDAKSDVEQDADSDDHAAVRVLERDGKFTLPRASRSGRGRAANRPGRQLAGRRGAPGAARVARAANRGVLRGVARGGRRCRGKGRGVQPAPGGEYKTWEEEDDHAPPVFEFEPQREAGFHFPEDFAPVCEMDFFAFDQLASTYRLLCRSKKSWKCLFYDLVEVATINSYILMQEYRKEFPDAMPRPTSYSQSEYRANLTRQLAGIAADEPPPLKVIGRKRHHQETEDREDEEQHLPVATDTRRNYFLSNVERKSSIACTVCKNRNGNAAHFCLQPDRQCFQDYHQR